MMASPQNINSTSNNAATHRRHAVHRALGASEILDNILGQLERNAQREAARVSLSWARHCARLLWQDPPPAAYANMPPRVVRAFRGAVRTLYAPRNPDDLANWTFPGVRMLHLPYDYLRSGDTLRRVLGRCGARLRTVVVAPDGQEAVQMRFISFAHIDENDFGFYQDDMQGYSVPGQQGWEGLGDDDGQAGGAGGDEDGVDNIDWEEDWSDDEDEAIAIDPEFAPIGEWPNSGAQPAKYNQGKIKKIRARILRGNETHANIH
jgi:hypothetical protein